VGSTGSGKSTTIASMLDHRNELRAGHILTLEDPIEYLFKNKKSIINQREIGSDTKDFYTALRNSMRQAPDCILIGEIRDKETMTAALAYAQSGHLVLATLHANNSYNALNRIISFFPIENRAALLQDLSSTVKAIVSQRLIRSINGGTRTAAVEVMLNTRHIADLIEKGEIGQIKEALENSLAAGSQSFEMALFKLVQDGQISQDEALANADSATNLLWLLNNGPDSKQGEPEQPAPVAETSFTEFTLHT
jgi:twitching motility protein PilU